MKRIALSQGYSTIVDDEDYDRLICYSWSATIKNNGVYAVTMIAGKIIYMHRFILNVYNSRIVDHKDHNTLDNQKSNLQITTSAVNNHNRTKKKNTTSQYKGVYWNKFRSCWRAQISHKDIVKYIGSFNTESEAAEAYNVEARKIYGSKAVLNKIRKEA